MPPTPPRTPPAAARRSVRPPASCSPPWADSGPGGGRGKGWIPPWRGRLHHLTRDAGITSPPPSCTCRFSWPHARASPGPAVRSGRRLEVVPVMRKILVGTDTTASADMAVSAAAELAGEHEAELLVLYVRPGDRGGRS